MHLAQAFSKINGHIFPEFSFKPAKANLVSFATGNSSSTTIVTGSPCIITLAVKALSLPLPLWSTKREIIFGSSAKAANTDKK